MMRTSRANPKIYAYTNMFGHFNFNVKPFVIPGTKVVTNKNLENSALYALHRKIGLCVVPEMENYR